MIDLYASSVVPAAQQQPDYQGTWLFIDRASGKGVSVCEMYEVAVQG